jgi:amino acid transporter
MSGVASSIFMILAVAAFNSGADSKFLVVLTIAISTTLISYLWIFPAAVKLRFSHPHVHRPYRVPFGDAGLWIAGVLTTFWVALGSWVAVFPGTLEKLLGIDYDFKGTWGVSRGTYEALTLGTLAVILAFAVIGYALSRSVREQVAVVPRETDPTAPAPAV